MLLWGRAVHAAACSCLPPSQPAARQAACACPPVLCLVPRLRVPPALRDLPLARRRKLPTASAGLGSQAPSAHQGAQWSERSAGGPWHARMARMPGAERAQVCGQRGAGGASTRTQRRRLGPGGAPEPLMYRQNGVSMRPRQMRLLRLSTHSMRSDIFFVPADETGAPTSRSMPQPLPWTPRHAARAETREAARSTGRAAACGHRPGTARLG